MFAQRSVYALTDGDDDRLSANCWLANPALEEPDAEPEVVKCDLLAWCKRYLPDLELEEELKKDTEDRQEDIVRPKRPRYRVHLVLDLQSILLPPPFIFIFLFTLALFTFLLSVFCINRYDCCFSENKTCRDAINKYKTSSCEYCLEYKQRYIVIIETLVRDEKD